jgi:hypothetical protein
MPENALELLFVTKIRENEDSVSLFFAGGREGRLLRQHKNYDYYVKLAKRSVERGSPLGVTVERSGQVGEIEPSDVDIVKEIFDRTQSGVKVWFEGHDGTFKVAKDNPRFRSIVGTLEGSARSRGRVWFIVRHPSLQIMDVCPFGGKES